MVISFTAWCLRAYGRYPLGACLNFFSSRDALVVFGTT
jgi:hypothetical protein